MELEIIQTKRLLLRRLSADNIKNIYENCSEKEIRNILGFETEAEYLSEKARFEKGYTTHDRSFETFQIIDKASGLMIGSCGYHNWYPGHHRAEIGYAMTRNEFRKKGIMSEALHHVLDHGFNKMKLHRVESMVGPDNIPSLKLMEKFKFVQEGILRQHHFSDPGFEDSLLFSKLATEHQNR